MIFKTDIILLQIYDMASKRRISYETPWKTEISWTAIINA